MRLTRALAATAPAGSGLEAIEHVVILIQENRSFDHYFGSYRGVRGFDDPHALRLPGGAPVFAQPGYAPGRHPAGRLLPFHLDTRRRDAECTHDISHVWAPQHASLNGGAMDGFVRAHLAADGGAVGPLTMGYYTRADLPLHYALADAFTICDGYHCSLLGPTNPNRLMSVSATIDPGGAAGGPVLDDSSSAPTLRWATMPERLQDAGVSWKVYQSPAQAALFALDPSATANNVLAYFAAYQDAGSPLHARAFTPTFPGELNADVLAGTLPSVSWVLFESALPTDEHPPAPPAFGAYAIAQLLRALAANPVVWSRTVLFIAYDENGGFFDHVPPPTAPRGTAGEYVTVSPLPAAARGIAGPVGLGFRVPLLVVSPFARGGWVCSDTFDHTSLLRFIETRFGVSVPNLSAWRRSVTGDLVSALGFGEPADPSIPALPATSLADPAVRRECPAGALGVAGGPGPGPYPVPPNATPHQEPGAARRRPGTAAPAPASRPLRIAIAGVPKRLAGHGFRARVSIAPAVLVARVQVRLDGRTLVDTARARFALSIRRRELRAGRNVLTVVVRTRDGGSVQRRVVTEWRT
jgi:phospholipase C